MSRPCARKWCHLASVAYCRSNYLNWERCLFQLLLSLGFVAVGTAWRDKLIMEQLTILFKLERRRLQEVLGVLAFVSDTCTCVCSSWKKNFSNSQVFFLLLVGIFFFLSALSGGRLEAVLPFHDVPFSHAILAQLGTCRSFAWASRCANGCGLHAQRGHNTIQKVSFSKWN